MKSIRRLELVLLAIALLGAPLLTPQQPVAGTHSEVRSGYVLGPQDVIAIRALNADEIADKSIPIGSSGYIHLPLVGRVRAAGLTVEELEAELTKRLADYLEEPQVVVTITEFGSQPVSVLGAVNKPGVYQLRGGKTLLEILSMAGGLRPDAGQTIKITRRLEWGRIPLPNAVGDSTGALSVAELNLASAMEAKNADANVSIRPNDVVSVPRAEMVYVMGEVGKPGGFVLNERETLSVLQAVSLAGGLSRTAAPQHAKIFRASGGNRERQEVPVDLKLILAGNGTDVALQPDDILLVPNNRAKTAGMRAVEAAIQLGTGVVIWRR